LKIGGGYLDDATLSATRKSIIRQAMEYVAKNNPNFAKGSDDWYKAINDYIEKQGKKIVLEIEANWSGVKDDLADTATSIMAEEETLAQQVYDLWVSTFEAIAKARKGLIGGDAISKTLLGDIESQIAIIQQLMSQGLNLQEIQEYLNNPNADTSRLNATPFNMSQYS
jgi:hypothetical protein